MFDLKVINSVLDQLEEERGIPREKIIEAIEAALATAYKKEYGKKGQIVRATFDLNSGKTEFYQIKKVFQKSLKSLKMSQKRSFLTLSSTFFWLTRRKSRKTSQ
jgi:hypothetical protein